MPKIKELEVPKEIVEVGGGDDQDDEDGERDPDKDGDADGADGDGDQGEGKLIVGISVGFFLSFVTSLNFIQRK